MSINALEGLSLIQYTEPEFIATARIVSKNWKREWNTKHPYLIARRQALSKIVLRETRENIIAAELSVPTHTLLDQLTSQGFIVTFHRNKWTLPYDYVFRILWYIHDDSGIYTMDTGFGASGLHIRQYLNKHDFEQSILNLKHGYFAVHTPPLFISGQDVNAVQLGPLYDKAVPLVNNLFNLLREVRDGTGDDPTYFRRIRQDGLEYQELKTHVPGVRYSKVVAAPPCHDTWRLDTTWSWNFSQSFAPHIQFDEAFFSRVNIETLLNRQRNGEQIERNFLVLIPVVNKFVELLQNQRHHMKF